METKKTYQADLEHRRPTAFLLGLVLALALVAAALQFSARQDGTEPDEQLIDDIAQDMETLPVDQRDMVSAGPRASAPSITENVKPVEQQGKAPEELEKDNNPLMAGNGEGAVKQADVTTALPQQPANLDNDDVKDARTVEQLPMFPGGWVELMKWLTSNLKYPPQAEQRKIQGEVVVSFIINKDGTIANVKVAKSAHPLLDREALRVVRKMPKWTPGIENDKPCRTLFAIPVEFQL